MFTTHFPGNGLFIPPIYKDGDFPGGWFIVSHYCLLSNHILCRFPCFGIDKVGVNHVQNVEVVVGSNQETTISLEFIGYEMYVKTRSIR